MTKPKVSSQSRVLALLHPKSPQTCEGMGKVLHLTPAQVRSACNKLKSLGQAKPVGNPKAGGKDGGVGQLWLRGAEEPKPKVVGLAPCHEQKFSPDAMMDLWTAWRM